MFQNNVGISGVAFNENAPYFKSIPDEVKKKVFAESEKLINMRVNSNSVSKTSPIIKDNYKLNAVDKKTGAELWVNQNADKSDLKNNIKWAKIFLKNNISVKIREHVFVDGVKNPELEIDGKIGDFKHPEEDTHSSLQKQIRSAGNQKATFAAIILHGRNYTMRDFARAFGAGFQQGFNSSVEFVYLIWNDNTVTKVSRSDVSDKSYERKLAEKLNKKGNP